MGSRKVNGRDGTGCAFSVLGSALKIDLHTTRHTPTQKAERETRNAERETLSYGRAIVRIEMLQFLCAPLRAQAVKQSHAAIPSQY